MLPKSRSTIHPGWLFSQALGTTPKLRIDLQNQYDLARTKPVHRISWLRRSG